MGEPGKKLKKTGAKVIEERKEREIHMGAGGKITIIGSSH